MLQIVLLIAAQCNGPYVPPTGYDQLGNAFTFEQEVAVGEQSLSELETIARSKLERRLCGTDGCSRSARIWRTSSEDNRKCVFVIANPQDARTVVPRKQSEATVAQIVNQYSAEAAPQAAERGNLSVTSIIGVVAVSAGVLAGVSAAVSFADGIDELYWEPMSPDFTMASAGIAVGLATVGVALYFIGDDAK